MVADGKKKLKEGDVVVKPDGGKYLYCRNLFGELELIKIN